MHDEVQCSRGRVRKCAVEGVSTSGEFKSRNDLGGPAHGLQVVSQVVSKCAADPDETTCSYKFMTCKLDAQDGKYFRSSSTNEVVDTSNIGANGSKSDAEVSGNLFHKQIAHSFNLHAGNVEHCQHMIFKIDEDFLHMEMGSCILGDKLSIEHMKVEVACLFYLQLPNEKRSRGLLPVIHHFTCDGRVLESLEGIDALKDQLWGKGWIEVSISGWVQKRLMKLYIDCCTDLHEPPNFKLIKKLYNLEVSEDEIILSDCDLHNISVTPLLNALNAHKSVSALDLSHNLLGNGTVEKLKQVFNSIGQNYGALLLDLHCNHFGQTALFQICECPVLFGRLEVHNISGNRLTDACASYLSTLLQNCKALYSLNIERCSFTSRTIQKVADSLYSGSVLAHISLGYNHPISGSSLVNLFAKLGNLKRFAEVNLNGLKLSKPVVDSLCQLSKTSYLAGLMLGGTNIRTDGALQLIESLSSGIPELVKLDLSFCGLTSHCIVRLNTEVSLISGIIELNLEGNPIMQEGGNALASLLVNPQCRLKVLVVCKCQLRLGGVLRILQALADNWFLEELNLSKNACLDKDQDRTSLQADLNFFGSSFKVSGPAEDQATKQELCAFNTDCNHLEVADSEDEAIRAKPAISGFDDSCTGSCQKSPSSLQCRYIQ